MPTLTIATPQQLKDLVGKEVVVSDWLEVTQERIDRFAEAIDDRQWIHVDRKRAVAESPFGTTIAHGFLTLSLLSALLGESLKFAHVRMGVNYGLNRVRFTAPVPAGAKVRGRFTLQAIEDIPDNGVQMTWGVIVERDGGDKPCLVAEWLTRRYE
jgi:acyl dehydratase